MNARTLIAFAALVTLAQTACAQSSQERRDYILAHQHGWAEVTIDDRAIPQVPSNDEDHPGPVKPESCSLHVELGGEPFVYGSVYPIGDLAPYSAKSGFRFPAPIGSTQMQISYSGCDVEGDKGATVEVEAPIAVEESRVTEVEFDGARLAPLATRPNSVITLDDVYRAVTGKPKPEPR
jgi:hypothetical protein